MTWRILTSGILFAAHGVIHVTIPVVDLVLHLVPLVILGSGVFQRAN